MMQLSEPVERNCKLGFAEAGDATAVQRKPDHGLHEARWFVLYAMVLVLVRGAVERLGLASHL